MGVSLLFTQPLQPAINPLSGKTYFSQTELTLKYLEYDSGKIAASISVVLKQLDGFKTEIYGFESSWYNSCFSVVLEWNKTT